MSMHVSLWVGLATSPSFACVRHSKSWLSHTGSGQVMCPVTPKLGSCARITSHLDRDANNSWLLVTWSAKSANLQTGSDFKVLTCLCETKVRQRLRDENCRRVRALMAIVNRNVHDPQVAPAFNLCGKIGHQRCANVQS